MTRDGGDIGVESCYLSGSGCEVRGESSNVPCSGCEVRVRGVDVILEESICGRYKGGSCELSRTGSGSCGWSGRYS